MSTEQKLNANQHVQRYDILHIHAVNKPNMWNDALGATVYEENKKAQVYKVINQ